MGFKLPAGSGKGVGMAVAIAAGVAALWWIAKKGKDAAAAIANVNQGTPYAGAGIVGTLGHGVDAATGGAASSVGSSIGLTIWDWFNDDYDPTAPAPKTKTGTTAKGYGGASLGGSLPSGSSLLPTAPKQLQGSVP